jgi:hypothetical protein
LASEVLSLPDLPRLLGPSHQLLGAIRWALPLLTSGIYASLAIQGALPRAGFLLAGISLTVGIAGGAHATLLRRRRRLLALARQLERYAERTVGREHELRRRAMQTVDLLERRALRLSAVDPNATTATEQRLRYTRELLRSGPL